MRFKAVCTDIDGTLLNSQRELSPLTIETISRIGKKLPVILASSRMPAAMVHLQQQLEITGQPLISYNGGYVIQYHAGKLQVFNSVFIPISIAHSVLSFTHRTNIHTSIFFEDEWYAPQEDQWSIREEKITKVKPSFSPADLVLNHLENLKAGPHKLMCMGAVEEIEVLCQNLSQMWHNELHLYRSRPTYIEIAPKQISKASALALLLSKQNISLSEVIAYGDNYNDIEMLEMVGHGVAVGNAIDAAKVVAKEVTSKSIDDGVALNLLKYF
jgi:Cof subfamily protein (haloacid dehalogenase superfamily)